MLDQPRDGAALTNRGNAYSSLGDLERPWPTTPEALDIDPADVITLVNRANTYARLRSATRPWPITRKAFGLAPDNARARNHRGNLYVEMDLFDDALGDYTEAIRVGP